ncbi:hypothetical protein [Paenibacillus rhizophilus]|uniref:Uncharacterized protein n=1 Tax=Paenibacillus rhizophilus TaxID=1850366 RepID=A0A3N9P3T7_9BACL|nr:hypothetical protein [Paenibacillus rhizophilus]RQW09744.1 hypothetical protein EH198_18415 [Paenibacillus rhizophilus]
MHVLAKTNKREKIPLISGKTIFQTTSGKTSRYLPAFYLFLAEMPDLAGDFPAWPWQEASLSKNRWRNSASSLNLYTLQGYVSAVWGDCGYKSFTTYSDEALGEEKAEGGESG